MITFSLLIRYYNSIKIFVICFSIMFIGSLGYTLTQHRTDLVPIWILMMIYTATMIFAMSYYALFQLFPAIHKAKVFAV